MTDLPDLDIARLRKDAKKLSQITHSGRPDLPCGKGCKYLYYHHQSCAVLALIERLEKAERELACTKFKLTSLEGVYEDECGLHDRQEERADKAEAQRDELRMIIANYRLSGRATAAELRDRAEKAEAFCDALQEQNDALRKGKPIGPLIGAQALVLATQQRDRLAATLMRMVDHQGVDCDDPQCPSDDTCKCPTPAAVNAALAYLNEENKTDE